jgi:SAM-dependent methyltransferase/uncharacterized protein YbaR (Trm112 family)
MTLSAALPLLVCPESKQPLVLNSDETHLLCPATGAQYIVHNGIPHLVESTEDTGTAALFEALYTAEPEPWSYSERAAEVLRHEFVSDIAHRFAAAADYVLDVGCSNGQLSARLGTVFPRIVSLDISPTAVHTARTALISSIAAPSQGMPGASRPHASYCFLVASSTALPLADASMDAVIVSDGLHGWELSSTFQRRVLLECHRVLKPGGYAIFTDYLHPNQHHQLLALVEQSPLAIVAVEYLYDRLWYQMESLLRAFHGTTWVKALLKNMGIARTLKRVARLFGARGSKHICVVAQKTSALHSETASSHTLKVQSA